MLLLLPGFRILCGDELAKVRKGCYRSFGSEAHSFKLNPPISEYTVELFEKEHASGFLKITAVLHGSPTPSALRLAGRRQRSSGS
jgi:hypothetical protein